MAADETQDRKHEKVRIGVFFPRWMKEALEKIAEREGRSVADLVRQQMSTYLRSRTEPGKWTEEKVNPPGVGKD